MPDTCQATASEAPSKEPRRMTDEDYIQVQGQLMLLAQAVQEMDLDGFRNRIEECQALGPILNPTEYRAAMYDGRADTLDVIREVAIAASTFKASVLRALERWTKGGVSLVR